MAQANENTNTNNTENTNQGAGADKTEQTNENQTNNNNVPENNVTPKQTRATKANEKNDATKDQENEVTISRTEFDALKAQISSLQNSQKEFETTASQDQMRKIEALRASGKLIKSVKIRSYQGKPIIAWESTENEVYVSDNRIHEKQTVRVTFDDKTKKEISLKSFTSGCTYEEYEVINETKDKNGELILHVEREDGRELDININYIN